MSTKLCTFKEASVETSCRLWLEVYGDWTISCRFVREKEKLNFNVALCLSIAITVIRPRINVAGAGTFNSAARVSWWLEKASKCHQWLVVSSSKKLGSYQKMLYLKLVISSFTRPTVVCLYTNIGDQIMASTSIFFGVVWSLTLSAKFCKGVTLRVLPILELVHSDVPYFRR